MPRQRNTILGFSQLISIVDLCILSDASRVSNISARIFLTFFPVLVRGVDEEACCFRSLFFSNVLMFSSLLTLRQVKLIKFLEVRKINCHSNCSKL